MNGVMRAMDGPTGLSLIEQAQLVAMARVQEFQSARQEPATERPAQFELHTVLGAMAGSDLVRRVQAVMALQEYMHAPGQAARRSRGRLHELVSAGDMATTNNNVRDYIDRFLITPSESDDGWRQLFTVHEEGIANAQANRSGFRVLILESGIVFKKRLAGEAIEFKGVTGSEQFVTYLGYGGGVSIERTWWDDQDYLSIGDMLMLFREAAYSQQSDDMYGLLTALNASYNFSTGADLIAKMNGAAAHIIRALQGKGVNVNAQSEFTIVCPVEKIAEVNAALLTMSDVAMQTATSKTKLAFRFKKPITTVRCSAAGGIYVGLAGGRNKAGIRQDLTMFGQFNIARYCDDLAGFLRYAGYIEEAQWRRIP